MKLNSYCALKPLMFFVMLLTVGFGRAQTKPAGAFTIGNLQVEYTSTPMGIDVTAPRFSWQMIAPAGKRAYAQVAYQIQVKDAKGNPVWNSDKTNGGESLGITYTGTALKPVTRYIWTVTVWNQSGATAKNSSWFETGLMNPDPKLSAWDGATWIGGGNDDLVLYSKYLPIFNLKYNLAIAPGSTKAAMILGANDPRLMDKNKNIYQVQNGKDESYFKVELDVSAVGTADSGKAKINIYRVGYTAKDTAGKPFKTFEIKNEFINQFNKNKAHIFDIVAEYGTLNITLDGSVSFFVVDPKKAAPGGFGGFRGAPRGASVNLNPVGSGGDYLTYGMLCDIGFAVDAGQKAAFSDVSVSNVRKPGNTLFAEDLTKPGYDGIYKTFVNAGNGFKIENDTYQLDGGSKGLLITADPSRNAMPMLRTAFTTASKKIETARLYVTSRGIYEVYLNGKRVGNDYYNPGLTQYNITHFYQTYDVTNMVNSGKNAIGAMLGEGWWSGLLSFGAIWNHFGDRQSLLAKLVITYTDGSKDVITTNDKDWKYYNKGPVIYSSLDMGEVYDATREAAIKGWSTADYNDNAWKPAQKVKLEGTTYSGTSVDFMGNKETFNFDKLSITGQIGENAGIYKTITAKSIQEVRPGVYVYNMGQNFVGVPKITIKDGKAGAKITLRYAEVLYPKLPESFNNVGMLMTENYRAALSQDTYVMTGGDQVIQPHFTSRGLQYIEITGIDKPLPLADVQGLSISSVKKLTADYATSNRRVNQLWSNLVWSNIDDFLTIPTDCPQRNERMGWSGDISIFSPTATYISNADQFFRRHMFAMRDLQTAKGKFTDIAPIGGGFGGVLWGSAGITVPWETYEQYKDVALLAEHYDAMAAYITYIGTTINKETGFSTDNVLGDWLGPQYTQLGTDFLVTAYHVYDLGIMEQIAKILGKNDDVLKYKTMYDERKAFFNKTFVNADKKTIGLIGGGIFGPDPSKPKPSFKVSDTQTSYAVPLVLGVFSDENIPYMVKNLKAAVDRENTDDNGVVRPKYSLMTGFIGTAAINKALSDNGGNDLAYRVLQNNKFPSWLYAVDQGATTIWERLNGYTVENGFGGNNSMNSFDHYSFGAIGQWMMAYSLGIQRDEAGFKKFILQPEPDPTAQMTWAKGYYDSEYGRINSSWKVDGHKLTYNATVPANTRATLYLPASAVKTITEGGKPMLNDKDITFIKFENSKAVYELKSGSYSFSSVL